MHQVEETKRSRPSVMVAAGVVFLAFTVLYVVLDLRPASGSALDYISPVAVALSATSGLFLLIAGIARARHPESDLDR